MRVTNNSSFCYFFMSNECTFYFSCSKIVSRNNNYIIDTSSNPVITILISSSSITCKIFSIKL